MDCMLFAKKKTLSLSPLAAGKGLTSLATLNKTKFYRRKPTVACAQTFL